MIISPSTLVISPDNFRIRDDGSYDSSSEASERAWDETYSAVLGALVAKPAVLTLLVGLPGSGKSTWAYGRQCFLETHEFTEVVVDATFSRRIERTPLLQMAARSQVPVDAVVFMTPLIECLSRNSTRPPDRRIPFSVIARMHENMQREPVLLDEGFRTITAVRTGDETRVG